MSKQPPRAKRKTSSYIDDEEEESCMNQLLANLNLADKSTTPKVVAKALLSLLPDDATKNDPGAKKLVSQKFILQILDIESHQILAKVTDRF